MRQRLTSIVALAGSMMILQLVLMSANALAVMAAGSDLKVVLERTVTGFAHPESVAFDPGEGVLYVSQFGSVLRPTLKDGKGKISKVNLSGRILEGQYLPAAGDVLNKPKGIWIEGKRLWVTDIDTVWVFDLATREGRKLDLPGALFANDLTVIDNILFVSDSETGKIFAVEPADFLKVNDNPDIIIFVEKQAFFPNGLYPSRDESLLTVGRSEHTSGRSICSVDDAGRLKTLFEGPGRFDGVAEFSDGSLLISDWSSKSLLRWHPKNGMQTLATGFAGPADFCIIPEKEGLLVVIPDLVKSELRMIHLSGF